MKSSLLFITFVSFVVLILAALYFMKTTYYFRERALEFFHPSSKLDAYSLESFRPLLPNKEKKAKIPLKDNLIFFDWDVGGWNNIRMGMEVVTCIALFSNSTLVVPERSNFYRVMSTSLTLFDYFDLNHFASYVSITFGKTTEKKKAYSFPKGEMMNKPDLVKKLIKDKSGEKFLNFPKGCRMFGQYTDVFPEYLGEITSAFRIKDCHVISTMRKLLAVKLLGERYSAIHVRRGELQYKDIRDLANEKIIQACKDGFDTSLPILVVSDEYQQDLLDGLKKVFPRVECWAKVAEKCDKFDLIIDMLACVPAVDFIGTPLSTFSTGIQQWRARWKIEDKIMYSDLSAVRCNGWMAAGEVKVCRTK